jgi:hypothetical protein
MLLLVHPVNNEVMRNDDEIAIEADSWRIFFTEELAGCTNYAV